MATKREYGYLEFTFKTSKAAWRLYRFLDLGKELGILPNVEFQFNGPGKSLVLGWWQPVRRKSSVEERTPKQTK